MKKKGEKWPKSHDKKKIAALKIAASKEQTCITWQTYSTHEKERREMAK